jgi:hypothetical protein
MTYAIITIAIASWSTPRMKFLIADPSGRLLGNVARLQHQMEMVGSASLVDVAPKIRLWCTLSYVLYLSDSHSIS